MSNWNLYRMIWNLSFVLVLDVVFVRNEGFMMILIPQVIGLTIVMCLPPCLFSQDANVTICEMGSYFETSSCMPCPSACASCKTESWCTTCKHGYYGDVCSQLCAQNCNQDICNKISGACLKCKEGFFFSENGSCISCAANCKVCDSENNCLECFDGFKGDMCNELCNNCKVGTPCSQSIGYCIVGCNDGFCGTECNIRCNSKCLSCDRYNPTRCVVCAPNRYGTYCIETCPKTCHLELCHENNGSCTLGCKQGFWGTKCELECPGSCKNKRCTRDIGTCEYGCMYNYTGKECICPNNCQCDDRGACENCTKGFGEFCQYNCSDECAHNVCHRDTGQCLADCLELEEFVLTRCRTELEKTNIEEERTSDTDQRFLLYVGFAIFLAAAVSVIVYHRYRTIKSKLFIVYSEIRLL